MGNLATAPCFKPAGPGDEVTLLAWVKAYYAEDGLAFNRALVLPALVRLLQEPTLGRAFFMEVDGGEGAGYVVFTFGFDHEAGGPLATVTDLFVAPAFRRRGLARAALDFVVGTCRTLGVRGVELQVETHNLAGQALYRGFGFRSQTRLPMFLAVG